MLKKETLDFIMPNSKVMKRVKVIFVCIGGIKGAPPDHMKLMNCTATLTFSQSTAIKFTTLSD